MNGECAVILKETNKEINKTFASNLLGKLSYLLISYEYGLKIEYCLTIGKEFRFKALR